MFFFFVRLVLKKKKKSFIEVPTINFILTLLTSFAINLSSYIILRYCRFISVLFFAAVINNLEPGILCTIMDNDGSLSGAGGKFGS